jgi:hypothetical protein
MKTLKIFLLCSSLIVNGLYGQVRLEKDYAESFPMEEGQKISLSNKYGEVIVHVWNENRVKVNAVVEAEGKSREVVDKIMDKVRVAMRKSDHLLSIETLITTSSGFGDVLGDYSRRLLGKQRLSVNYELWMPHDLHLSLNNRYGNIYLASLSGPVEITLAHGDLRGNNLEGRLDVEHSFGKASFDYVSEGRFVLKGVRLEIEEGGSLDFMSSSSEVSLKKVDHMKINSRSDDFTLTDIGELSGTGRFTEIDAQGIAETVMLDFEYGEIRLSRLSPQFVTVDLKGKSTDIDLVLNQSSYIRADISGDERKMIVPNSMMSLTRNFDEEEGIVNLKGMVGYTQDYQSILDIDADGGDLVIAIRETEIFTDRR